MTLILFAEAEGARGLAALLKENWHLLVGPVLGFAAIYLLLPRARGMKPLWGGVAAGLALILGGAILVRTDTVFVETLLFHAFSGLAIGAGVLMITQKNPVHAALSFALVVLSTCGLFLLQAAPFLMAATIIVYAGAIVVTFLFVIMLAQQEGVSNADQRSREPFLASLAGCILLAALVCILHRTYDMRDLRDATSQLKELASAKDDADVKRVLGDPTQIKANERSRPLVETLKAKFGDSPVALQSDNLQIQWARMDVKAINTTAGNLLKTVEAKGSLALYDVPGKADTPSQHRPGALPAGNVAALGQSLFTDYLIPVELAATLLLVATIGAIVIAGRRSEVLR